MKNRQRNCPRTEESKETRHCDILELKKKKKTLVKKLVKFK